MLVSNPLACELDGIVVAWNDGVNWRLWLRMGKPIAVAIALLNGLHR